MDLSRNCSAAPPTLVWGAMLYGETHCRPVETLPLRWHAVTAVRSDNTGARLSECAPSFMVFFLYPLIKAFLAWCGVHAIGGANVAFIASLASSSQSSQHTCRTCKQPN